MEEIRKICYGITLEDAYKHRSCIFCKNDLKFEFSEYTHSEVDQWLKEGLCPVCTLVSQKPSKLYKTPKLYAK